MHSARAAAKLQQLGKLPSPHLYETLRATAFPSWDALTPARETELLGLRNLDANGTLTIVGAGITGLTTAWLVRKARPDVRLRVVDNRRRVGGWMETTRHDFGFFESGPRTLMPGHVGTTMLLSILAQAGKLDLVGGLPSKSEVNKKAVFYQGKPQLTPYSLGSAISFLFSPLMSGAQLCGVRDLLTRKHAALGDDESVHSFVERRLGAKIGDRMISAIMRGIYAGDSRKLSARSVARLNNFYTLEKHGHGLLASMLTNKVGKMEVYPRQALALAFESLTDAPCTVDAPALQKCSIYGFREGIQPMAQVIADDLVASGVELLLDTPVKALKAGKDSVSVELQDGRALASDVVVSTVAKPELFEGTLPALLGQVQYNTLAVVNVWVPDPAIARNWFGILVPRSEDGANPERAIGVIFDSSVRKAMGVPQEGSNMTVMLGGDLWQERSEEQVLGDALAALQKMIGPFDTAQAVTNVRIQRGAIPQLNVGHDALTSEVHAAIARQYDGRVALAGMAFGRGCGVSDCVLDGFTLALRFAESRKQLDADFFFRHYLLTTDPARFV